MNREKQILKALKEKYGWELDGGIAVTRKELWDKYGIDLTIAGLSPEEAAEKIHEAWSEAIMSFTPRELEEWLEQLQQAGALARIN